MSWCKIDIHLMASPRFRLVGNRHGAPAEQRAVLAYMAILFVNARHGCKGNIEELYSGRDYLATFCTRMNEIEFRAALEHLAEAGLIDLKPTSIEITGYCEHFDSPVPSTERVRIHRRLKAEREAMANGKADPRAEHKPPRRMAGGAS